MLQYAPEVMESVMSDVSSIQGLVPGLFVEWRGLTDVILKHNNIQILSKSNQHHYDRPSQW